MLRGVHRQRDRRNHERHGGPSRGFGKRARGAARTESRLAPLAAECRRDVAAFAALQQHDNDDEEANQYVNSRDQINHDS